MAKDVKFNIRLTIDGKEHVVAAQTDIRQFAREFAVAQNEVKSAGRAFADTADRIIAIKGAMEGLRNIMGVLGDLSAAYNTQAEAETRLATVMRQRMDATDEDIQAMKDLASAQQELGVVGDEVQLAALQQVATFATERSTLETLLPAMNNLLVQQKGVNATQSDAIAIANKAGKALMGQTGELREAGITFTAAQEQVMKFGTEQERAAMFAQVVTENVGEMNAELAKTDGGKAQQTANYIGDLKEEIGGLYAKLQPLITGISNVGMAIATSISAFVSLRNVVSSSSLAMKMASMSANILKKSLYAIGPLAAVFAIFEIGSSVLGNFTDNAEEADEKLDALKSAEDAFRSTAAQAKFEIDQQAENLKKLMQSNADTSEAVKTLNEKYGDIFGTHKTAAEWYDTLTAKSRDYCMQLGYEAKAKELARQIADKQIAADVNAQDMKRMEDEGKQYEKKVVQFSPYKADYVEFETAAYRKAKKNAEAYKKEIADLQKQMDVAQKSMEKYADKLSGTGAPNKVKSGAPNPGKPDPDAPEGSLKWIEQQIADIRGKLSLEVDPDSRKALSAELKRLEDEKHAIELDMIPDGSVKKLEQRIADLHAKLDLAVDPASRTAIAQELKQLEDEKHVIELELKYTEPPEAPKGGSVLAMEMPDAAKNVPSFKSVQKTSGGIKKNLQDAADAASAIGTAFGSLGDNLNAPALNAAGIVAQAIATIALSYSQAMTAAAGMGPWMWIAFAATGLAQLVSVIAAVKNATAFAEGGIVSGPTMALVGEYAGASNNPEVIAPLNRLRQLIRPAASLEEGQVTFRIKGRTLEGVLQRVGRMDSRS